MTDTAEAPSSQQFKEEEQKNVASSNSTTQEDNAHLEMKTLQKVAAYPMVNSLWENTKEYYAYAKEKSSIAKYAAETMESGLEKGTKWVEPVLQSDIYKKCEPYLVKADEFGVNQIEKIEKASNSIVDTYSSSKQMVENKVNNITNDIKATTNALVEVSSKAIEEKIVPPVDNYLKGSMLAKPIDLTLGLTEKIVDAVLPAEEEKAKVPPTGPVVRAGRITKRIQRETLKKLKNLTLRPPEARDAMKYTVDLIQYAATQIDNGRTIATDYVVRTKKRVKVSVENSTTQVVAKLDQQRKKRIEQTTKTVHVITDEAISALHKAIEILSKQVPEPVVQTAQTTFESLKDRTKVAFSHVENSQQFQSFSTVAKTSVHKLQDVTQTLTTYTHDKVEPKLPGQLVQSVTHSLHTIIEELLSFLSAKPDPIEQHPEDQEEEEEDDLSDSAEEEEDSDEQKEIPTQVVN